MAIFRAKHDEDNHYVIVDKKLAQDSTISDSARGLLLRMLSKPDDWDFYTEVLAKEAKDRYTSVSSSMKELVKAGYVEIISTRDEKGRYLPNLFNVYEGKNKDNWW